MSEVKLHGKYNRLDINKRCHEIKISRREEKDYKVSGKHKNEIKFLAKGQEKDYRLQNKEEGQGMERF